MNILISNDDGYLAPGIQELAVVSADSAMSQWLHPNKTTAGPVTP